MNATTTNRIDAYRNEQTGEIAPPHRIGTTSSGHDLYQYVEGWEPVARIEGEGGQEEYAPTTRLRCDRDGNWYVQD